MPITLDAPVVVQKQIASYSLVAFGMDVKRMEGYLGYESLDVDGAVVADDSSIVLSPVRLQALIARISQIAGVNVYPALEQAMLEFVATENGVTGTVG